MPGGSNAFFGLVRTPLVRHGVDERLRSRPEGDPQGEHPGHTSAAVHSEMLLQVARDYAGIDVRTYKAHQLRFLYNGLRSELIKHSGSS